MQIKWSQKTQYWSQNSHFKMKDMVLENAFKISICQKIERWLRVYWKLVGESKTQFSNDDFGQFVQFWSIWLLCVIIIHKFLLICWRYTLINQKSRSANIVMRTYATEWFNQKCIVNKLVSETLWKSLKIN